MTDPRDELTDYQKGFNDGLARAGDYHEKKACAADKWVSYLGDLGDGTLEQELILQSVRLAMVHREHRNAISKMRILTEAEKEQERAFDERYP